MLTNADIAELTAFRRTLHRFPEVSRQEAQTASRVTAALRPLNPAAIVTGLGGHGVAAVWDFGPGPSALFRCELDALPIEEVSTADHRSTVPGTAHLCGHDGHITILLALARLIARTPPSSGRVILMFQPAEEDGSGAAAVIADPAYENLRPDWAFSLHNFPGAPLGRAWIAPGPVNCASVGLRIALKGRTSHAAEPENGRSPAKALARLIPALIALGNTTGEGQAFRLVTVTHAALGVPAFGITPGHAEVWATLRTLTDPPMTALRAEAVALAKAEAQRGGFALSLDWQDDFAASVNDAEATARFTAALDALRIPHDQGTLPERASEDFGRFGAVPGTKGAMVFLGAGTEHPALHNPDYDFPDDLIPIGAAIFDRVMRDLLG